MNMVVPKSQGYGALQFPVILCISIPHLYVIQSKIKSFSNPTMAAEEADPHPLASSIIDECHISSSQQEILANSKFALEDHVFSGNIDEWLPKRTAQFEKERKELEDKNYVEFVIFCERCGGRQYLGLRRHRTIEPRDTGEYVAFCSRCGTREYIGIRRDRKRCYENFNLEVGSSDKWCTCTQEENPLKVDPPWKKSRASGLQSSNLKGSVTVNPLAPCSEKIAIDSEDIDTPTTNTMGSGVGRKDRLVKTTAPADDYGNGKSKADDTNGNGNGICTIDHTNGNGKGKSKGDEIDTNGNGNGNGDGKSKGDERIKNLFQMLRILAAQARIGTADTDTNIDIFETAKRRGMKFPVSRFRLGTDR